MTAVSSSSAASSTSAMPAVRDTCAASRSCCSAASRADLAAAHAAGTDQRVRSTRGFGQRPGRPQVVGYPFRNRLPVGNRLFQRIRDPEVQAGGVPWRGRLEDRLAHQVVHEPNRAGIARRGRHESQGLDGLQPREAGSDVDFRDACEQVQVHVPADQGGDLE